MSADELGKDLERAHDWCDRQGLPKNEDLGERLAPWIEEREQALRFAASEMELLTRERDEARTLHGGLVLRASKQLSALESERDKERARADANSASLDRMLSDRDEWKARAEAAEADNATLLQKARGMFALLTQAGEKASFVGGYFKPAPELVAILEAAHPGAALLEDRKRIAKTLDAMDVPSEADEAEKGRACDFAGRVELLATWGQRGWREYRKAKDSEAALLERLLAAEKVVEVARNHIADNRTVEMVALGDALAAYDALKEGA